MQQFSIYEIKHQLAEPAIKTRTDKRSVFTIENGSGGVPYTFDGELYSTDIPNPFYDSNCLTSETGEQPEFLSRQVGWHRKLDRTIVPHFGSHAAALKFLIESLGYANENHARSKNRHIKEHFEAFEVPLKPRKGYDPTPIQTVPKRMRSTLRMHHQRGMLKHVNTKAVFALLKAGKHGFKRRQHDERMARQDDAARKRREIRTETRIRFGLPVNC